MLDKARSYLGRTWIGTNSSDSGECVGFVNRVVLDVTGVLYPIKGAVGAKDLLTASNTRPDLMVQVRNDPLNPNQLPSVGDWVIWGATWGSGYGHVACVENVSSVAFTSIEQNFVAHTVTRQQHNWSGVIGWLHIVNQQGADEMIATVDEADKVYKMLRPNGGGNSAELAATAGKRMYKSFVNDAQAEIVARDAAYRAQQAQIAALQVALTNAQNKPPVEVIKEVEKIVEVIKEVPVYTHDEQTKNFVAALYNYFYTRYQTFRDSIKK